MRVRVYVCRCKRVCMCVCGLSEAIEALREQLAKKDAELDEVRACVRVRACECAHVVCVCVCVFVCAHVSKCADVCVCLLTCGGI